MKKFLETEIEIIKFAAMDVITASPEEVTMGLGDCMS